VPAFAFLRIANAGACPLRCAPRLSLRGRGRYLRPYLRHACSHAPDPADRPVRRRHLRKQAWEQDVPVGIAVLPDAGHGETAADGRRTSLRYPRGHTRMTADFAKGALAHDYGDARLYVAE